MPELPEVETVKNALIPRLAGKTVTGVEIFTPKMREPLMPLPEAGLEGCRITGVRRRGRYFIIDLNDGRALLGHLGMSGVIRVESAQVPKRKHEHIFIHLDDGMIFRFECTRRFSSLKVCTPSAPGGELAELAALGAEPLSEDFTHAVLFNASRNRKTPVKVFIMDNTVVVGVGNIYATEALFAARISPLRPAGEVTEDEYRRLTAEIKKVLQEAIEAGGSTIHDFKHVDGSEGKFAASHRAYGKAGQPCPVCGTLMATAKLGGRSSCYCPVCQK